MGRVDHYEDPDAPRANSLAPAASAIVVDEQGGILLQRRADTSQWSIPGGAMEIGETIAAAAQREVREETGLEVRAERITGIYSNPRHVVAFPDGEVRQQFSVCFLCTVVGGRLQPGTESTEVAFVQPRDLAGLDIHPSIRLRIQDYFNGAQQAAIR